MIFKKVQKRGDTVQYVMYGITIKGDSGYADVVMVRNINDTVQVMRGTVGVTEAEIKDCAVSDDEYADALEKISEYEEIRSSIDCTLRKAILDI